MTPPPPDRPSAAPQHMPRPPEADPAAGARRLPAPRAGGAILIAMLVALLMDPGLPGRWAREAPLPPEATLALVRAADAVEGAAVALGLDRPARALEGLVDGLREL